MHILLAWTNPALKELAENVKEFLKSHSLQVDLVGNFPKISEGMALSKMLEAIEDSRNSNHNTSGLPETFFVTITEKSNRENRFSIYQLPVSNRNIVIYHNEEDWNRFLPELDYQSTIAFLIIENCIQILMEIDYSKKSNYIHLNHVGCVNDFIIDKFKIKNKIVSGNICYKCYLKFSEKSSDLIYIFKNILESVRKIATRKVLPEKREISVSIQLNYGMKKIIVFEEDREWVRFTLTPREFALYACVLNLEAIQRPFSSDELWRDESMTKKQLLTEAASVKVRGTGIEKILERKIDNRKKQPFYECLSKIRNKIQQSFIEQLGYSIEFPNPYFKEILKRLMIQPDENNRYSIGIPLRKQSD